MIFNQIHQLTASCATAYNRYVHGVSPVLFMDIAADPESSIREQCCWLKPSHAGLEDMQRSVFASAGRTPEKHSSPSQQHCPLRSVRRGNQGWRKSLQAGKVPDILSIPNSDSEADRDVAEFLFRCLPQKSLYDPVDGLIISLMGNLLIGLRCPEGNIP
ncbi:MAG: hypothetical protein DRI57_33345 [Deltaproteobacteria bacterium]|nr:MAG: hypothetical protein DRI57_33345 [Deltaproteobacteria bacterium]